MSDDRRRDRTFLGQGLAFPLQISPRGGISLVRGERDIEQSIRIILETSPGERVMRPEFGCRIHDLVFASNDASTQGLAIHWVKEALDRWEPRIDVLQVDVSQDTEQDGVMLVNIHYRIKDTHNDRSIVYPFYLTEEPEPL